MLDADDPYLAKAAESLAGAESELANARYNNSVSRSYYSCFQAAIHALVLNGVRPRGTLDQWGHDFVQAQFVGLLVNRRKLYPADLRQTLFRNLSLRHEADYGRGTVTQIEALRALRRSRQFGNAVLGRNVSGS
ncbi:MAG: HEPN domain-containing protein [Chloroflexi bacterium]|nr:HEPN domain-containing protein [Chloroflexota bacterium]